MHFLPNYSLLKMETPLFGFDQLHRNYSKVFFELTQFLVYFSYDNL